MRHNKTGAKEVANLIIEVPDDLAQSLERIAAAEQKSVQQLAIERLSSLVANVCEPRPGTAAAVLRAMREPPYPSVTDIGDLDTAIEAGRLRMRTRDLFSD